MGGLKALSWVFILSLAAAPISAPSAAIAQEAGAPTQARKWQEAAAEAAHWLRSMAVQTAYGSAWADDALREKVVGANLESGVAGKVIFFLELYHQKRDKQHLADARRGADYLLASLPEALDEKASPPPGGLYYGVAGVGYVLNETFKVTGDSKYRAGAMRCVQLVHSSAKKSAPGASWSDFNDILFGDAGTGLFLLYAARQMGHAPSRALAVSVGRRLVAEATKDRGGLSWRLRDGRDMFLPNFSHGAAGISYFLATLYQETARREFLEAAKAGAAHLMTIAKSADDLFLVPYGYPNPDWQQRYEIGWAHGVAGTARLFFRLWQITRDRDWLRLTESCARGILQSGVPDHPRADFAGQESSRIDLRFGTAGAADFLLSLYRHTGKREYLDFARVLLDDILKKSTVDTSGRKWRTTRFQFMENPGEAAVFTGYFYGAAGYGLLFLRAEATERGRRRAVILPDDPFTFVVGSRRQTRQARGVVRHSPPGIQPRRQIESAAQGAEGQ